MSHHVAQKRMTITLPFKSEDLSVPPCKLAKSNAGILVVCGGGAMTVSLGNKPSAAWATAKHAPAAKATMNNHAGQQFLFKNICLNILEQKYNLDTALLRSEPLRVPTYIDAMLYLCVCRQPCAKLVDVTPTVLARHTAAHRTAFNIAE